MVQELQKIWILLYLKKNLNIQDRRAQKNGIIGKRSKENEVIFFKPEI